MKTKLFITLTAAFLLLMPNVIFGQTIHLGSTSGFAIFTKAGAITNTGAATKISGNVGSFSVSPTGFTTDMITGTIYSFGEAPLATASADVTTAYADLSGTASTVVLATPLDNQVLVAGVYGSIGAATLNGNITLNGQGNSNAIFIIKINGSFAVGLNSNVILTNSASLNNVYWQVNGQFDLGTGSVFRGTAVASGAVNLLDGSSVFGRVLTTAGAITLTNSIVTIPENAVTNTKSPNVQNRITILSNRLNSTVNITVNDPGLNNCKLKMYNALGVEFVSVILTNKSTTISTNHFPKGIYFYKVLSNDKIIQSGKLMANQ